MDSELVSSSSANSETTASGNYSVPSNCTLGAESHSSTEILYLVFSRYGEKSLIFLLSVLLMTSGFILFIYGLISGQLYQFVMAFFFLVPGLILDNVMQLEPSAR